MKTFNLIGLSLLLGYCGVFLICEVSEYFLGSTGMLVAIPLGMLVGLSSRQLTEKLLGYTFEDLRKQGNSNG